MVALSSCCHDPPGHSLFLSFLGLNSSVFPWSLWSASYSFNIVLVAYVGQLVLLLTAKGPKLILALWSFFDASYIDDPSLLSYLNLAYVSSKVCITVLVHNTCIIVMYSYISFFHFNMNFLRKRMMFYSFTHFQLLACRSRSSYHI